MALLFCFTLTRVWKIFWEDSLKFNFKDICGGMGKVSQLTWDLSKALSNRLPHTSASGEKVRQVGSELCKECFGAWDMFSCRSSYSTLKIHIFYTAAHRVTLRQESCVEGSPMLWGLWQAEQMRNFILKETTSFYELPLLSLQPLLVAFAFLESEHTTQKKQFVFSI